MYFCPNRKQSSVLNTLSQAPLKILFVGHDANRAGAQILLLHLLAFLREQGLETALVLAGDGPLYADYEKVTNVYRGFLPAEVTQSRFVHRALSRIGLGSNRDADERLRQHREHLLEQLRGQSFDLIFSNTIANGRLLRDLSPLGLPMVAYVHELETAIQTFTRPEDLRFQLDNLTQVFTGSEAVRRNLVQTHGLAPERATVLKSLVRTDTLLQTFRQVDRSAVRRRLGIPEEALVVGGCGNAEWRKGIDLFLLTAGQVLKTHPETHFVWVGVPEQGIDRERLSYDLTRMGLGERVHLLPPGGDYLQYVACFDLFTLTSREDPYPLVILEAGLNRNPVLCFTESGGSPDFVGTDTGCLIPYLDLAAMAEVIRELADDPERRKALGEVFYQRAMAHDVTVLVPKLLTLLH